MILDLLVFLALLEGGSRVALRFPPFFRRVQRQSDAAWRLEWIRRHAARESPPYGFDIHHPTRGWALRPRLRNVPAFQGKILNTNSRGLRGTSEHSIRAAPGKSRILLLGDSFSFGEEVSDWETAAARLETLLPDTEVLNLGVHGYGLDQMLIYYQEEGSGYHPDRVILGFVYEDIHRDILSFRDFAKPRFYLRPDGSLRSANLPIPSPEHFLATEWRRPRLLDLFSVLRQAARWRSGANQNEAEEVSRAILRSLAGAARRDGAVPIFFYFPVYKEVTDRRPGWTPGETFLLSFCAQEGLRCSSLRPALASRLDPTNRSLTRGHWLPEIHAEAARLMAEHLLSKGAAPHRKRWEALAGKWEPEGSPAE